MLLVPLLLLLLPGRLLLLLQLVLPLALLLMLLLLSPTCVALPDCALQNWLAHCR